MVSFSKHIPLGNIKTEAKTFPKVRKKKFPTKLRIFPLYTKLCNAVNITATFVLKFSQPLQKSFKILELFHNKIDWKKL